MQPVRRVQLHSLHDLTRWFCGLHSLSQPGPPMALFVHRWVERSIGWKKLLTEPGQSREPDPLLLWPFKQAAQQRLFVWLRLAPSWIPMRLLIRPISQRHRRPHTQNPIFIAKDVACMSTLIFIPVLGSHKDSRSQGVQKPPSWFISMPLRQLQSSAGHCAVNLTFQELKQSIKSDMENINNMAWSITSDSLATLTKFMILGQRWFIPPTVWPHYTFRGQPRLLLKSTSTLGVLGFVH